MSGGFPVTLVDAGGAPFTPASRLAPLATVSDAGVPVTLVSSGGAPLIVDGWTPADLGVALLGQIDAEDFASLTITTGLVDAWADTVAAVSYTALTTARPTYSATSFNGRPGVTFNGTTNAMTYAGVPYPTGATPCEIWAAVSQSALVADTTARIGFAYGDTAATTFRRFNRQVVTGANRLRAAVGTAGGAITATEGTVDFSGICVTRSIFGATSVNAVINGTAATPAAAIPTTTAVRSRIGAVTSAAPANFWHGIFNCILITSPLTNVQAASLRAYLARRGGI